MVDMVDGLIRVGVTSEWLDEVDGWINSTEYTWSDDSMGDTEVASSFCIYFY